MQMSALFRARREMTEVEALGHYLRERNSALICINVPKTRRDYVSRSVFSDSYDLRHSTDCSKQKLARLVQRDSEKKCHWTFIVALDCVAPYPD